MIRTTIFCALLLSHYGTSQVFLKTQGQKIVNQKGENVYLKGLGLGGWMLQEGYMLKTADFAGTRKTENGEWLQYTLTINLTKEYKLHIRYNNESATSSRVSIKDESGEILAQIDLPPTDKEWKTISVQKINLSKGEKKLRLYFDIGNVNINFFELK